MTDTPSSPTWPSGPEFAAPSWEPNQRAASGDIPPPPPSSAGTGGPSGPTVPTHRSWQPGIMALRPLSFGDFLSLPFKAIQFNRSVIIGGPLIFTLVSVAASVAALLLFFNELGFDLIQPASSWESVSSTTVVVSIVAFVITILGDTLSTAIVAPGVAKAVLGERLTFISAWRTVIARLWQIILLYVLVLLALTAIFALYFLIAWSLASAATAAGVVFVVIGGIGFALVSGAIALYTVVARPIIILEKISALTAVKRSWRLMKGRFWWTVLIVLVASIMIGILSSVIQTGLGMVSAVGVLIAPDNPAVMLIIFAIVTAVGTTVSYVIMSAYMGSIYTLIYTDLRIRHEGFHLDLARAAEARAATAT